MHLFYIIQQINKKFEYSKAYEVTKFRPRSDEVTGEWMRLHNGELNDLYWGMEEIA